MTKTSRNLKSGIFTKSELKLYGLNEKEIEIIIQYQKELPILQCDIGSEETKIIDGRELHKQIGVKSKYADWIKRRIDKYEFIENIDFTSFLKSEKAQNTYINTTEYNISLEMAKMLAMVENNDLGKRTRKYFIAIEKAFKNRLLWNREREFSIEMCKELKRPLFNFKNELEKHIPNWFKGNVFSFEFNMLNCIIIGTSATTYRKQNNLKPTHPIRNTFDKKTLILVHKLEQYDAILLEIEKRLNWEDRRPLLETYYNSIKNN